MSYENETQAESEAGIELLFVLEGKEPVTDLNQLHAMAVAKKAVFCPSLSFWKKPKPAAFVLHLQGMVIRRLLNSGMYVYPRKSERIHA